MSDDKVTDYIGSYIPDHPVFKKEQKKIRVVFNASQNNSKGVSINSLLHVGPKLQEDVLAFFFYQAWQKNLLAIVSGAIAHTFLS